MKKIIYGVDTTKKITPILVRDAVIECFIKAHKAVLDEMKELMEFKSEKELEDMQKINVRLLIKKKFEDIGGDFEKPTKENLIAVCGELAEYAKNFRDPEIVKKHYAEIFDLIKLLK